MPTKQIVAVACGTCRDVHATSSAPDGCRACRVPFVGEAPRALVSVGIVVEGVRVSARTSVDFQGLWTLDERVLVGSAIERLLAEGPKRVEPTLRLVHSRKSAS